MIDAAPHQPSTGLRLERGGNAVKQSPETPPARVRQPVATEDPAALRKLATLVRCHILTMTPQAGSGHPTSSLSATELMVGLLFGGTFHYDVKNPQHPNNDRLIFSKGHASPLLYALWTAAGALNESDLASYRRFGSRLEGHPTTLFPYADAATGSLGQGLGIGVGMALNARYLDRLSYRTYVLIGDSEMAEGSQWEAMQIAAHYKLDNLLGILDVNRLGQRGETMYGWDLAAYRKRVSAFGWETLVIDGHSFPEILSAYEAARRVSGHPTMIIARTVKGKGVSFLEDKEGWHGKTLNPTECEAALKELGEIDESIRGAIPMPEHRVPVEPALKSPAPVSYPLGKSVATRDAFGNALVRIFPAFPDLVSLDGEVSNSTKAATFKEAHPDHFFEMYIAAQNMVSVAVGLACRGKLPFVSTFAAFLTRAFDQIRMSPYSGANLKIVGSHAGVSIGQDGPSQMGLEDIAMFRAVFGSVILYPCDAVSAEKLVEAAAGHRGLVYIRTTREASPVIYGGEERFVIGGSKVLRKSDRDVATVIAAGVTVHEALAACDELKREGIAVRVVDLYSVKPLDEKTLREAASATGRIITVEDHYPEGGIGEAVRSALAGLAVPVRVLAVRRRPKSGMPEELLDYEEISRKAIIGEIRRLGD
jgi:transketolase